MSDQADRSPSPKPPSETPARPFFRPSSTRESASATPEPRRRATVPPFSVPGAQRPAMPQRPATPPRPATPARPVTPEAMAALPSEPPARVGEPTPPAQPAVPADEPVSERAPAPEARVDLGQPGAAEDDFQIVVGESLLAITGEYEGTEWSSLSSRGDGDVEHPGDDGARLGGSSDRRDSGGLRVTQESGLDWDSWEYGRNSSPVSDAADGLIINRHELPPEAANVGLTGGAVDEHGEDRFLRSHTQATAPDETAAANAPLPDDTHERREDPAADPPAASFETVARTPPETIAALTSETAPAPMRPATPSASTPSVAVQAEAAPVSAPDLEALKEVEPWALPPEPQPARAAAGSSADVAERLERIAERVRRGELSVPADTPAGSDEAALAAVLSALFRASQR